MVIQKMYFSSLCIFIGFHTYCNRFFLSCIYILMFYILMISLTHSPLKLKSKIITLTNTSSDDNADKNVHKQPQYCQILGYQLCLTGKTFLNEKLNELMYCDDFPTAPKTETENVNQVRERIR